MSNYFAEDLEGIIKFSDDHEHLLTFLFEKYPNRL